MEEKNDNLDAYNSVIFRKHHYITLRTFGITLLSLFILTSAGYLLDKILETKPLFLIISLIFGFPITQTAVYISMRKYANKKLNSIKNGKQ